VLGGDGDEAVGVLAPARQVLHLRLGQRGAPARTTYQAQPAIDLARGDAPGVPAGPVSVRVRATVIAPEDGTYRLRLSGWECTRLFVDGALRLDLRGFEGGGSGVATEEWTAGSRHEIELRMFPTHERIVTDLTWHLPSMPATALDQTAAAVAAARDADAVVIVGGLDHRHDTEGRDRADLALPDGQDAAIAAIAAANPATVVALYGGGAVAMPWLDQVRAVLMCWYGGSESGPALADVLCGRCDPGGRLPVTFPRRLADHAAHAVGDPLAEGVDYAEGLLCGHRWYDAHGHEPLFAFGHGLSYTIFALEAVRCDGDAVLATVRNAGDRAGRAVVQLYAERDPATGRPPRQLAGFAAAELDPGERAELRLAVAELARKRWDEAVPGWVPVIGPVTLAVGFSSRDLRQRLVANIGADGRMRLN
jgi:beta-glucosidase